MNACGTLGVITKMAARIYPLNEVQALPVMGFDTYADAVEFMKTVVAGEPRRALRDVALGPLHDHEHPARQGGNMADSSDYLKIFMTEPWKHPEDRPYSWS